MDEKVEFTKSEQKIIKLVIEGKSNSEICEELNISLNTVKTHIKHVLSKLSIKNRTQLSIFFLKK